jgi:hypothetical protein
MKITTSILSLASILILSPATALAGAGDTLTRTSVPFQEVTFNDCAGELVSLSGTFSLTTHIFTDGAGGTHSSVGGRLVGTGIGQTRAERINSLKGFTRNST